MHGWFRKPVQDRHRWLVCPAVRQPLASSWLEGDRPDREDVKDFVDLSCGVISEEEYSRRSLEKARRIEAKNKTEKLS